MPPIKKPSTMSKKMSVEQVSEDTPFIIYPDSEEYVDGLATKGKPDKVTPALSEVVSGMELGDSFQLRDKEPFTISQIRYWQPKGSSLLADGLRLQIAGGDGRNIEISVVAEDGKPRGRNKAETSDQFILVSKAKK